MGIRTKVLTASVAVCALAMAVPVAAQDEPVSVSLAYLTSEIDGPMASTLARLDQHHGRDTVAVEVADAFFQVQTDEAPDCVVVIGRKGDTIAEWMGDAAYDEDSIRIVGAQGATRHETAELAADELVRCRS